MRPSGFITMGDELDFFEPLLYLHDDNDVGYREYRCVGNDRILEDLMIEEYGREERMGMHPWDSRDRMYGTFGNVREINLDDYCMSMDKLDAMTMMLIYFQEKNWVLGDNIKTPYSIVHVFSPDDLKAGSAMRFELRICIGESHVMLTMWPVSDEWKDKDKRPSTTVNFSVTFMRSSCFGFSMEKYAGLTRMLDAAVRNMRFHFYDRDVSDLLCGKGIPGNETKDWIF